MPGFHLALLNVMAVGIILAGLVLAWLSLSARKRRRGDWINRGIQIILGLYVALIYVGLLLGYPFQPYARSALLIAMCLLIAWEIAVRPGRPPGG